MSIGQALSQKIHLQKSTEFSGDRIGRSDERLSVCGVGLAEVGISLTGRYRLFDTEQSRHNISVGVGLKVPSGNTDVVDTYPEITRACFPTSLSSVGESRPWPPESMDTLPPVLESAQAVTHHTVTLKRQDAL
jgi:hypothetical protein